MNISATKAPLHLSPFSSEREWSENRISSGSSIKKRSEDDGDMSLGMKRESSMKRFDGVERNINRLISFLHLEYKMSASASRIVGRIVECRSLSKDSIKNNSDPVNDSSDFVQLQVQLFLLGENKSKGVIFFATFKSDGGTGVIFKNDEISHTIQIYTFHNGSGRSYAEIQKESLLSPASDKSADLEIKISNQKSGDFFFDLMGDSQVTENEEMTVRFGLWPMEEFEKGTRNQTTPSAQNDGVVSRQKCTPTADPLRNKNFSLSIGKIVNADFVIQSTPQEETKLLFPNLCTLSQPSLLKGNAIINFLMQ